MRSEYNFIKALNDLYEKDSIRESNNDLIVIKSSYLEVLEDLTYGVRLRANNSTKSNFIQNIFSNASVIFNKEKDNK